MPFGLIFAICLAFITAMNVRSASAQFCDDRFPWTCQGPGAPIIPRRFEQGSPVQPGNAVNVDPALGRQYAALYGPVSGERFPIPAVRLSDINSEYLRTAVFYPTHEQPGTIVIDPQNHFLYLIQGGGRALRYGVGVGRQGFGWSGVATISLALNFSLPASPMREEHRLRHPLGKWRPKFASPKFPIAPSARFAPHIRACECYRLNACIHPPAT
jgi:lipoprotein-anchoring transpeptidase ErfK/SrfK